MGDTAGDRCADVDQVPVPVGAQADHAVAEHDRIGLRPRHVGARGRAAGQLVGRAREGGLASHFDIAVHELPRRLAVAGGPGEQVRAAAVQPANVQGGRHADPAATGQEGASKVEAGRPMVETAVHVRGGDRDQPPCALDPCGRQNHAHRQRRRRAGGSGQHPGLVVTQPDHPAGPAFRPGKSSSQNSVSPRLSPGRPASCSRSSTRRILPEIVFGRSANSSRRTRLYGASRSLA